MKEDTTDLSIKISSQSVKFRQIYGLLKNEALSAITAPSSRPTTHHPTFAPTTQQTTLHHITFDDDSVANAESQLYSEATEDVGMSSIVFIVVISAAAVIALLASLVVILKLRGVGKSDISGTTTSESITIEIREPESEFHRRPLFSNVSTSMKTDCESELNDVIHPDSQLL